MLEYFFMLASAAGIFTALCFFAHGDRASSVLARRRRNAMWFVR